MRGVSPPPAARGRPVTAPAVPRAGPARTPRYARQTARGPDPLAAVGRERVPGRAEIGSRDAPPDRAGATGAEGTHRRASQHLVKSRETRGQRGRSAASLPARDAPGAPRGRGASGRRGGATATRTQSPSLESRTNKRGREGRVPAEPSFSPQDEGLVYVLVRIAPFRRSGPGREGTVPERTVCVSKISPPQNRRVSGCRFASRKNAGPLARRTIAPHGLGRAAEKPQARSQARSPRQCWRNAASLRSKGSQRAESLARADSSGDARESSGRGRPDPSRRTERGRCRGCAVPSVRRWRDPSSSPSPRPAPRGVATGVRQNRRTARRAAAHPMPRQTRLAVHDPGRILPFTVTRSTLACSVGTVFLARASLPSSCEHDRCACRAREGCTSASNVGIAFGLTIAAGLSTGLGSAIAFFAKRTNLRLLSVATGFSGGVMLWVSFVEILPKAQQALGAARGAREGAWLAVGAFFLGTLLILAIDRLIPGDENPHEVRTALEIASLGEAAAIPATARLRRTGIGARHRHRDPQLPGGARDVPLRPRGSGRRARDRDRRRAPQHPGGRQRRRTDLLRHGAQEGRVRLVASLGPGRAAGCRGRLPPPAAVPDPLGHGRSLRRGRGDHGVHLPRRAPPDLARVRAGARLALRPPARAWARWP